MGVNEPVVDWRHRRIIRDDRAPRLDATSSSPPLQTYFSAETVLTTSTAPLAGGDSRAREQRTPRFPLVYFCGTIGSAGPGYLLVRVCVGYGKCRKFGGWLRVEGRGWRGV